MARIRRPVVRDAATPGSKRVNFQIGSEQYERLCIHAVMSHTGPGAIMTKLIDDHLHDWTVEKSNTAPGRSSTPKPKIP